MDNVNKLGLGIICLLFGLMVFMLNLYTGELKEKKKLYELYETAKLEDYIPDMTYGGFKNSLEFIVYPDDYTSYHSRCIN